MEKKLTKEMCLKIKIQIPSYTYSMQLEDFPIMPFRKRNNI